MSQSDFSRRRQGGRPKKSTEERLTEVIKFNVRPSDFLRAVEESDKAGLSLTAYAREKFLKGHVIIKETKKLDHDTYDTLRRIGVNLNQLTRLGHQIGKIPGELSEVLASIQDILSKQINND